VKSPESVRSEFLAIVRLPPLSTVILLAKAVVEFPTSIVCPDEIVTLTPDAGTLPDDQFEAVSQLPSPIVEIKYEQVPHEGLLAFDKLDPLLKPEGSEEILETHHLVKS
jgi:hypothetical protein